MSGRGGGRLGKQYILSVFVMVSCLFFMPGDQEVGKKVEELGKNEADSGRFYFLSVQVIKELIHTFCRTIIPHKNKQIIE